MSYCTQGEIETTIPPAILINALDDNADGVADSGLLATILDSADNAVNALLAPRFGVPFAEPAPPAVRESARVFALERIYDRRPTVDKNPYRAQADEWRTRLQKIGAGELPLDSTMVAAFVPGAAITSNAAIAGNSMA